MFINISNHPSNRWDKKQLEAAKALTNDGLVVDIPFPAVSATASSSEVISMADSLYSDIMSKRPDTVMVAGEFTLAYTIIKLLTQHGVKVVAACSDRCVDEVVNKDGTTTKTVNFKFIQFREFPLF